MGGEEGYGPSPPPCVLIGTDGGDLLGIPGGLAGG